MKTFTRRDFLKVAGLGSAAALMLAACGSEDTAESSAADTSAAAAAETAAGQGMAESTSEAVNQEAVSTDAGESAYITDEVNIIGNSSSTLYPFGKSPAENSLFEVYEYLFAYIDYNGEVKPILADATRGEGGIDHEAGTGDYTVYIWDYITDANGHHITADDVQWSFTYQFENETLTGTAWRSFESVEVVDDTTVIFHFSKEINEVGTMDDFFASCFVISQQTWEESDSELQADSCGTGPYKIESYTSGTGVTLVARDDYWQTNEEYLQQLQRRNATRINYIVNSESAQQLIALESGEVDIVSSVNTANLTPFLEGGEYYGQFTIFSYPQAGVACIFPNEADVSMMANKDMRLSIFYAIDTMGVVALYGGTQAAAYAYGPFGTQQVDFLEEWKTMDNYQNVCDLDLSKEYADKAGYNGETIKLVCVSTEEKSATIIVNMLTDAGFKIDFQVMDGQSTQMNDPANWDLCVSRYSGLNGAIAVSHGNYARQNSGVNKGNCSDDEWMDLLDEMITIDGHTEENIRKWAEMLYDGAHGMSLFSALSNVVYNNRITSICRNHKNVFLPGGFTYVEV